MRISTFFCFKKFIKSLTNSFWLFSKLKPSISPFISFRSLSPKVIFSFNSGLFPKSSLKCFNPFTSSFINSYALILKKAVAISKFVSLEDFKTSDKKLAKVILELSITFWGIYIEDIISFSHSLLYLIYF